MTVPDTEPKPAWIAAIIVGAVNWAMSIPAMMSWMRMTGSPLKCCWITSSAGATAAPAITVRSDNDRIASINRQRL